jgi:hypothetical protein
MRELQCGIKIFSIRHSAEVEVSALPACILGESGNCLHHETAALIFFHLHFQNEYNIIAPVKSLQQKKNISGSKHVFLIQPFKKNFRGLIFVL